MVFNWNLAAIKNQAKMSWKEKQQIQVKDDGEQKDGGEDVDDMFRTMWTGVPSRTKYKSNLGHKAVYNCAIPYLMTLMIRFHSSTLLMFNWLD